MNPRSAPTRRAKEGLGVDKKQMQEELGEKVHTLRELSDEFKERGQRVPVRMLINYIKRRQLKAIRLDGQYYVRENDVGWGMDVSPRKAFYERISFQDRNKNQGTGQAIDLEIRCSGLPKRC